MHSILDRLGIKVPIIQAPMAGVSNPELAAIASNAGGLGSLGFGSSYFSQMVAQVEHLKTLTDQPFNLNFFCHKPPVDHLERQQAWLVRMNPLLQRFDAQPLSVLTENYPSVIDQPEILAWLLEIKPKVVSFHFGLATTEWIQALKQQGIVVIGTATTPVEAILLEKAGFDAVIAQGREAGGHSGCFDRENYGQYGALELLVQLKKELTIPVIAAGGIMNGAEIAHFMQHGADAVQLGTAFVSCDESSASAAYKQQLKKTDLISSFTMNISGRAARGLIPEAFDFPFDLAQIPDYPLPYYMARQIIQAANAKNDLTLGAFWAGSGFRQSRHVSCAKLMQDLMLEYHAAMAKA